MFGACAQPPCVQRSCRHKSPHKLTTFKGLPAWATCVLPAAARLVPDAISVLCMFIITRQCYMRVSATSETHVCMWFGAAAGATAHGAVLKAAVSTFSTGLLDVDGCRTRSPLSWHGSRGPCSEAVLLEQPRPRARALRYPRCRVSILSDVRCIHACAGGGKLYYWWRCGWSAPLAVGTRLPALTATAPGNCALASPVAPPWPAALRTSRS